MYRLDQDRRPGCGPERTAGLFPGVALMEGRAVLFQAGGHNMGIASGILAAVGSDDHLLLWRSALRTKSGRARPYSEEQFAGHRLSAGGRLKYHYERPWSSSDAYTSRS